MFAAMGADANEVRHEADKLTSDMQSPYRQSWLVDWGSWLAHAPCTTGRCETVTGVRFYSGAGGPCAWCVRHVV